MHSVLAISIAIALALAAQGPDFAFAEQSHDFGTIGNTKQKSHTFEIRNVGDEPLIIKHIATSCGCTTTNYTKTPIKPGKKGRITVTFNPRSQRSGTFRKSVTVFTNSPRNYTRLFVSGEIKP